MKPSRSIKPERLTLTERRQQRAVRTAELAHRVGVPQFLARLVGIERAQHLCRDTPISPRHD